MVQRKTPEKLGIKKDDSNHHHHLKSEKKSSSSPSSPNPEIKTSRGGGPELKKMMKKSRSIKRSKPSAPQKPSLVMVTPQKPPQVKIPETSSSPNYMKSTTSSAARKERSQVSPHGSKTSSDTTSSRRKDSDHPKVSSYSSSVSSHKPGKTLMKTSSLRPVRTLTKTSSNKAKNSGRALYTDQEVRRATCSSTLKDTKFPTYVTLNPGGTESEGTSVMKVCPYTYCSLNGHHHAPLPPLKCFMSARRHFLKAQKSMRMKNLASGERKASAKPNKDIDTGQLVEEERLDFFVEIYARPREEDTSKSKGRDSGDGNEEAKKDFSAGPWGFENTSYSSQDGAETEVEDDGGEETESQPDDSSHSATSFEDNIDHDIDFIMEEMDTSMFFLQYMQMEEAENKDSSGPGDFSAQNESRECEIEDSIFDTSGMDWEEGEEVDTHHDSKEDFPIVTTDELTADEEVQIIHGENNEYLEEYIDGVDQSLETVISSAISNGVKEGHEIDALITIEASSDAEESPLEEQTQSQLEDEISTCCTYIEEQENSSSEPEIDQATAPEILEGSGDIGACLQEPEHNETDQGSATNKDQAKEAEYKEDLVEEISLKSVEDCRNGSLKMETEDETGAKETTTINSGGNPDQECPGNCSRFNKHIRRKKDTEEPEEPREFNPRGPRFLPLEPEVDPETVDLRHQMMDERRASEEWMLDYALRQAVSKLAPARKRKVALLVEAFETVSPLAKFEIHLPHTPTGFGHTRFMQACS